MTLEHMLSRYILGRCSLTTRTGTQVSTRGLSPLIAFASTVLCALVPIFAVGDTFDNERIAVNNFDAIAFQIDRLAKCLDERGRCRIQTSFSPRLLHRTALCPHLLEFIDDLILRAWLIDRASLARRCYIWSRRNICIPSPLRRYLLEYWWWLPKLLIRSAWLMPSEYSLVSRRLRVDWCWHRYVWLYLPLLCPVRAMLRLEASS